MMMSLYRPAFLPLHAPIAPCRTMQDNVGSIAASRMTTSMPDARDVSR
jgi:hypothetical protein